MTTTRAKVLVLLAAFNGSKWILEQVQSILSQVNVDVRLIIGDDGSTDGTRAIIERLRGDYRVEVIWSRIPTGSAAQNFMWLVRSTPADAYDFISFADQDDVWDADKLYRGCTALIGSGAQGYSSAAIAFWDNGSTTTLAPVTTPTVSDFLFESAGQGCTYVLDRIFYRRLRAFLSCHEPETKSLHYHDWAIYALARSWKLKWIFDREPSFRYRQHESNDTGARNSIGGVRTRLMRIKNGWYRKQLCTIAELCLAASPADPVISRWHHLLLQPMGVLRRWRVAMFCLKGGRRRWYDQLILLSAAIAGWI